MAKFVEFDGRYDACVPYRRTGDQRTDHLISFIAQSDSRTAPKVRSRGGRVSLHRPELDEEISIANLIAGVDWKSA